MARTKQWGTRLPQLGAPINPPNHPRPTTLLSSERLSGAFPDTIMALPLNEHSIIVVPTSYHDDDSPDAYWRADGTDVADRLFKTCIAYETLGENHPCLLPYLSRDLWTGFPVFKKPTGPCLEDFVKDNHLDLYPPTLEDDHIRLDPKYQPLVLNWALQLLSALKFIHLHNILYGTLYNRSFWLSSDLSLLLMGFMDAAFRDGYGYRGYSSVPNVSVKSDLYGWALFVYRLMTNNYHDWPGIQDFPMSGTPNLPNEFPAGHVLKKCYMQQYEDVEQLQVDFQAAMVEKGYELEDEKFKEFDPANLLESLNLNEQH